MEVDVDVDVDVAADSADGADADDEGTHANLSWVVLVVLTAKALNATAL